MITFASNFSVLSNTEIKINDTTLTYTKLIFIAPSGEEGGNDLSGDGSLTHPYETYNRAYLDAIAGCAIIFGIGDYQLDPRPIPFASTSTSASATYIYSDGLSFDIIGQGYNTRLDCTKNPAYYRDYHLFSGDYTNVLTINAIGLNIRYRGKDALSSEWIMYLNGGYGCAQNSLFAFINCNLINSIVHVEGVHFNVNYYNRSGSNGGAIENSIIIGNGLKIYKDFEHPNYANTGLRYITNTIMDFDYTDGTKTVKTDVTVQDPISEFEFIRTTPVYTGDYAWVDGPQFKLISDASANHKDITNSILEITAPPNEEGYTVNNATISEDIPLENIRSTDLYRYSIQGNSSDHAFLVRTISSAIDNSTIDGDMNEFSFGFWFKLDNNPTNNQIVFCNATTDTVGFCIYLQPDSLYIARTTNAADMTFSHIYCEFDNINRKTYDIDTWHWLLFSKNNNNTYQTFIDGTIIDTRTISDIPFQFFNSTNAYWNSFLGLYQYDNLDTTVFNGKIFDMTLSTTPVKDIPNRNTHIIVPTDRVWDGSIRYSTDMEMDINLYKNK